MTDSLRDQLLGLGFKPAPEPVRPKHTGPRSERPGAGAQPRGGKPAAGGRPGDAGRGERRGQPGARNEARPGQQPRSGRPPGARPGQNDAAKRRGNRAQGDIDLAKAYAIRAQREKDERIEAERQKQEAARLRREALAKLAAMLEGKALNAADADHVRHFDYGGKIKRVHVTAEQLRALNAGELGVLQLNGRYVLVDIAVMAEAEAIYPAAVALKVDPAAPAGDDPYADPRYQVPDDLVW
ncbi:DUF2058 family protein [Luteimonas sp. MC1828]|uniref:DUF2058 domain-containing protein n=1 Tax=Luteimonas sp. MC1828 TaxID=2799787 RepID=UPI0018F15E75|nr:DUF2058 family protein [Luteimonas sp. MC1828]MBJ7574061.1 DUF2058 family protein [Luteimonas sp. MC1828]